MEVKEVFVTPDQATKWLEGNTHNRALRQNVVERYARDIKAGKWRLTHEAIAFGPDGCLIDGQHRLWAIIEANTPARLLVVRGVSLEALRVINSGLVRSTGDHLRLGYNVHASNMEVAIARRIARTSAHQRPTTDEVHRALTTHGAAIKFALTCFPRAVRGITTVPVTTVVARATYHVEHGVLMRFGEALCEGRIDKGEDSALLLRNWLLERAPRTSSTKSADMVYAKTTRALFAFSRNERITTLYGASDELFPLPEETRTTTRVRKADNKRQLEAVAIAARPARKRRKS